MSKGQFNSPDQLEWDAWQDVMREFTFLGLSNEKINEEGTVLVTLLQRWAGRRAALLAFNASK